MSKVGWTVEAQHTLVTAAARDGTTLIAVVMKATDSTVKWSDTVALLDYGFEQFARVTIPGDDILRTAPDDVTLPDSGAVLDAGTYDAPDVTLLLPGGVPAEDVLLTYGAPRLNAETGRAELPVGLSLPPGSPLEGQVVLPEITVTAGLLPETPAPPEPDAPETGLFTIVLIICLSVVGLLLLAFAVLLLRRALIVRRRRRNKMPAGRRSRR